MPDQLELLERHLIAASDALASACALAARLGVRGGPAELYTALACVARVSEAVPVGAGAAECDDGDAPF